MKICEQCGAINDDSSKFCTTCGCPLKEIADVVEEIAAEEQVTKEPAEAAVVEAVVEETAIAEPVIETIPEPEAVPVVVPVTGPAQSSPVNVPKNGEHTVKGRVFGIIAFVLNLEALLSCLSPFTNFVALICSIIGLIFCRVSKNNTNFRLTKVAKVFGILALVFSIVTIILYTLLLIFGIRAIISEPQIQDAIGRFFDYIY